MPSKRRRKSSLKKGTQVAKPFTDEYIRSMAGIAGTKGKLLKVLMEEKRKERESPDRFRAG